MLPGITQVAFSLIIYLPPQSVVAHYEAGIAKIFSISDIFALTFGQKRPIKRIMNGNELLKKLKKLGKQSNIAVRFETKRGKGSHGTLYYGRYKTILKDRKKEIGPGLLSKMLTDLGLDKNDIE
jgi:predicted RNA binding protein YcfA (HicA-like mRNA interferase family)